MHVPLARGMLSLRAGRQELSFVSERPVSVRNNPDIRRSFDARDVDFFMLSGRYRF